jgi:hypothetical protein
MSMRWRRILREILMEFSGKWRKGSYRVCSKAFLAFI